MKYSMLAILLFVPLVGAQTYIGVVPSSTLPYGTIASEISHNCKNVVHTVDADKSAYALRADYQGLGFDHEPSGASLALFDAKGNVVWAKETRHIHNAFKDLCNEYLEKGVAKPQSRLGEFLNGPLDSEKH